MTSLKAWFLFSGKYNIIALTRENLKKRALKLTFCSEVAKAGATKCLKFFNCELLYDYYSALCIHRATCEPLRSNMRALLGEVHSLRDGEFWSIKLCLSNKKDLKKYSFNRFKHLPIKKTSTDLSLLPAW